MVYTYTRRPVMRFEALTTFSESKKTLGPFEPPLEAATSQRLNARVRAGAYRRLQPTILRNKFLGYGHIFC